MSTKLSNIGDRALQENVIMPQIRDNNNTALDVIGSRNLKSEWKVANSMGIIGGIIHSNGFPQKELP
jgi:hypothetical protein